ncbi:hypothetical protein YC2023_020741 [Brassica napus]
MTDDGVPGVTPVWFGGFRCTVTRGRPYALAGRVAIGGAVWFSCDRWIGRLSGVHIHRLHRSLTSSSLSSSLHQFTLDSSPYVHLLPISSPMELTVEVSALDLLSRQWSRMKRKRKLATAQSQASVGMGLLAGLYLYDTKRLPYKQDSGVSVDVWTSYAVRIMAISVFLFVIV